MKKGEREKFIECTNFREKRISTEATFGNEWKWKLFFSNLIFFLWISHQIFKVFFLLFCFISSLPLSIPFSEQKVSLFTSNKKYSASSRFYYFFRWFVTIQILQHFSLKKIEMGNAYEWTDFYFSFWMPWLNLFLVFRCANFGQFRFSSAFETPFYWSRLIKVNTTIVMLLVGGI